uniref:Uncharacterized protein n=1 Tax=Moniliophthora roreri TaxID=221103 RepID=A0A0W0FPZ7_MONRR
MIIPILTCTLQML